MTDDPGLDSVDFEIALTALLATIVSAYPSPMIAIYPAVKLAAISLLAITLVKRVAVHNGLGTDDRLIRGLTYLMEPASCVAILYCVFVAVGAALQWAPILAPSAHAWVFAVVTPLLVVGFVVTSELVFGDMLHAGKRIAAEGAEQHRGEMLGLHLQRYADWVNTVRTADAPSRATEPADAAASGRSLEELAPDEHLQAVANLVSYGLIVGAVGLAYVVVPLFAASVGELSWTLAVALWVASLSVMATQQLWYKQYGLLILLDRNIVASFFDRVTPYVMVILMVS